jgi:RimJ/RimL family protein N-acetyltransferase
VVEIGSVNKKQSKKENLDYFHQESKELIFRKASNEAIDAWSCFFKDNPGLKFLPIDAKEKPEILAKNWIENQHKRYERDGYGMLAIYKKDHRQLIGMGGILNHELKGKKVYEIAYSIIPIYWNKGYATEIAQQIKKYMILKTEIKELISIIDRKNFASIRVAEKVGMTLKETTNCFGLSVYIYGIDIEEERAKN